MLEVIVQNGEEAKQAEEVGADRLELVTAIQEGGLTPSYGTIKQVLNSVSIPVQVMIRPHSHHYFYKENEIQIIHEDIKKIIDLGGTGIVFGALNDDYTINERVLENMVGKFPTIDITFHRAFDEVASQKKAYQMLITYKNHVKRILTSGGETNCVDGEQQLSELVKMANEREGPAIMPGAGLSPENIQAVHEAVRAEQYHFGKAVRVDQSFAKGFDARIIRDIKKILIK